MYIKYIFFIMKTVLLFFILQFEPSKMYNIFIQYKIL